jgi:hypothetical protein
VAECTENALCLSLEELENTTQNNEGYAFLHTLARLLVIGIFYETRYWQFFDRKRYNSFNIDLVVLCAICQSTRAREITKRNDAPGRSCEASYLRRSQVDELFPGKLLNSFIHETEFISMISCSFHIDTLFEICLLLDVRYSFECSMGSIQLLLYLYSLATVVYTNSA